MSSKRRNEKVRLGNSHLTVYPYVHPVTGKAVWRFGWKDGDRWRYVTKSTKDGAKAAAEKVLEQQRTGLVWETLQPAERQFLEKIHSAVTPMDRDAVLAFIRSRKSSAVIGDAVTKFLESKTSAKGRESDHLKQVRRDLKALVEEFPGRAVSDIREAELTTWWKERTGTAGKARAHGIRGTLVMFWRWARKMSFAGHLV